MTKYHAVMIGEDGMEFGVDLEAESRAAAYAKLSEDYPESCCDQLEDDEDTAARQQRIYASDIAEYDDDYDSYED